MITAPTYKTKQFFFVLIKLSIAVAGFYFIYCKLVNNAALNFQDFITISTTHHIFSLKNITLLLMLTFLNWFLEIKKWQKLVGFIKNIPFKEAVAQSLGALTASLFTPNRIGEYGAKAAFFEKKHTKRILLINLLSNFLQLGITITFGFIGLYFFMVNHPLLLDFDKLKKLLFIGLPILALASFFIFKYAFTGKNLKFYKSRAFTKQASKELFFIGLLFSLARYLVFSFQFYFVMLIFGIEMGYLNAMGVITSMYFLSSILPSISIFDAVIKGSIAVYLFEFLGVNHLIVLAVVTLMWLFNFVLPSFLGSYYVIRFKFPKNIVQA